MLWEEDSAVIRIEEGGLYEISFAFFTKTKPSIQIIVNGESVMSAINSPSYVVHHSSGYMLSENGCLEPGTVSGLSLIVRDFFYCMSCRITLRCRSSQRLVYVITEDEKEC